MAREPTLVELLESGVVKLRLRRSDKGSLNNRQPYTGRATTARIHGAKGCIATFFDDQQFREGENYVTIEKWVSGPVEVPLASNFVGAKDAAGEQIYIGKPTDENYRVDNCSSVRFGE